LAYQVAAQITDHWRFAAKLFLLRCRWLFLASCGSEQDAAGRFRWLSDVGQNRVIPRDERTRQQRGDSEFRSDPV